MIRPLASLPLVFGLSGCIGTVFSAATDVVVGTASIATDVVAGTAGLATDIVVGSVDITTDVIGLAIPGGGDDDDDAEE